MNPLARVRSAGLSSSIRKAAVVLAVLLLVAAVVPFVVFAVPEVVGADHGFVILSGSMEPALSPGDVVIVAATTDVATGDIVTFDDGNDIPTTHRVVGTQDGQFVTKGDANERPDSRLVAREDLVGRVVLAIPLVGHVVLWANTPAGYVTLVLAPLALLAVTELYSWARRGDAQGADGGETGAGDDDTGAVDDDTADAPAVAADTSESADADPDTEPPASGTGTVAVAVADLKLTLLASASLLAYAGWNVYREVTTLAAPDPVSVGALTAGLLGLLFAAWVTVGAWSRARHAAADESGETPDPRTAETDGGTDANADRSSSDADGADSANGEDGADTEADR